MNRRNFMGMISLAAAGLCRPAAADEVHMRFDGPSRTTVSLQKSPDNKLYLVTPVNGRDLTMFIDTGATTIIDITIAKALGLSLTEMGEKGYGLNGGVNNRITSRVDLRLGDMKLYGAPVDCVDFSGVRDLSRQYGLPDFDGLIGNELLTGFRAVIDYGRSTLTLRRPG